MNGTDNKTVLLPSSESDNRLTGFSAPSKPSEGFTKMAKSPQPQQSYNTFFQEQDHHFSQGNNPFITLATPLFKHMDILLHTYDVGDVGGVHTLLLQEVETFSQNAAKQNLDSSQVSVTRYLLCTFLDELICTTYWGKDNDWAHGSLLSHFYRETYGGEKFFQLLTKLLASPANNIHLLEFMYVCISLGFEGKYRIQTKGKMELESIRDNLFKQIKTVHGRQSKKFYTDQSISSKQHHFFYKASYLALTLGSAILLSIIYTIFTLTLNSQENEFIPIVQNEITNITQHQFASKDINGSL